MKDRLAVKAASITKSYPGVRALDDVRFELRKGEVHALVGENGAGKSTLVHILGGVLQPDSGDLFLDGQRRRLENAYRAAQLGNSVVFQELSLAPNLSIAENVFFNRQPLKSSGISVDWRTLYRKTSELLDLFQLDLDPKTQVKSLSPALQQVMEILKALSQSPKVLILDEPTSSLTSRETTLLFDNIRRVKDEGVSVVYISHHLPEIFEICDRVTVLRDGLNVGTRQIADVTENELVQMMVGRDLKDIYGTPCSSIGTELLAVEGACRGKDFRDVDFSIREGEILGFAGLVGSGRTELARALFGLDPLDRGQMRLRGEAIRITTPREAIRNGIGYLTEDRKEDGLFLDMTIRENCIAPSLVEFANSIGCLDRKKTATFAQECRKRYKVITPSIEQKVRNLSGGNQQKVLLSMWLGTNPRVLIADEPTRGIDVGAKQEVYQLIRELASGGVAIVLISSDVIELLGVCDRIVVMREGSLVGEFPRETATEEGIIACAAGVN